MNYLRVYSFGSIISTSWRIYFRERVTLFLIYIIPLAFVHAFVAWVKGAGGIGLAVASLSFVFASMFVAFPLTVAISEICLGIKPSVARSYRRAFAEPRKLLGTYALAFGIILLGFVLFLVPGILFSVWYTFAGPVVVLEGLAGRTALKRSRELGRGYYLRNFGILFLSQLLTLLLAMVLSGLVGVAMALSFGRVSEAAQFLGGVLGLLVAPPAVIAFVLLYYDMRVRKEGYGAAQLADDLRF